MLNPAEPELVQFGMNLFVGSESAQKAVLWIRSDPELFGQVGSGLGIIVPDPDLTVLTRKSVKFVINFFKMV
jgi:hypothetical protein